MKNKAVFLDRDGTINVDKGYTFKKEDLELIPRVVEGLKLLQEGGYKIIITTNQSGIARGYFTEEDYFAFREEMHKRLEEQGVSISAEYFCPHHSEKGIGKYKVDCNCRKPKTGMLEEAARDFNLNLKDCWIMGDHESDIQVGKNAECKTIHILTGHVTIPIKEADFIARDMIEAAHYIIKTNKKP